MSRHRLSCYLIVENWSVEDVQQFLEKNGFGECCGVFKQRAIDGHAFLALTEGHLMLWKRDISMVNIRRLAKLIQELAQEPERHVFLNIEENGTTASPFKTNQTNVKAKITNQSILQIAKGTAVAMKNLDGGVANIVSNMKHVDQNSSSASCNTDLLAKICSLHVKKPVFQQTHNSESSSSCSDNCSWDTNFSDDDGDDEPACYLNTSYTKNQNNGGIHLANGKPFCASTQSQVKVTLEEPQKPPVPNRSDVYPNRDIFEIAAVNRHSKGSPYKSVVPVESPPVQIERKLPVPPIQQLQNPFHVKKILDSFNVPAAVEQWDEEEQYESIDNEHLPSREAIAALISHDKFNLQSQQPLSTLQEKTEEQFPLPKTQSLKSLPNGLSQPFEAQFPIPRMSPQAEHPPDLPERTSTMTAAHQSAVAAVPKCLPPALPITSRPLPPQPVTPTPSPASSSSSVHREPAREEQHEDEQYEIVDQAHISLTASAVDGDLSDEYELIQDNTKELHADQEAVAIDYYLQPVAKQNSCESQRPVLPPKPASNLEPPSLPVRHTEDVGNSTSPGNSGDGVTGFIDFFRKVRSKPSSSSSGTLEREKTPTPEVKKAQPLSPPDHKPPPPVDRPSAYQNNQRPLPPTPEFTKLQLATKDLGNSGARKYSLSTHITQMPWYHSVDRKRADELLRNSQDGTFLLRPSTQTRNPLSLTLWYNNRIYNISVRHRPDGKYALGYEKPNEQSFTSVEELIANYQSENLVLYSNGERTGKTLLTGWPQRRE